MNTISESPAYSAPQAEAPARRTPLHKLDALTGCRFFAALAVVGYHYVPASLRTNLLVREILEHGFVSVSFFFALSGFVLTYNYAQQNPLNSNKFWLARFARIYPMYFIALALVGIFAVLSRHSNYWQTHSAQFILGGILSLFCLQAWLPQTALCWNFPGWSLSCEAFFYACFPFLLKRLKTLQTKATLVLSGLCWLAALALPLVFVAAGPFVSATGWATEANRTLDDLWISYAPITQLPAFAFGICLGLLFLRHRKIGTGHSWLQEAALIAALVATLALFHFGPHKMLFNNGLLLPVFGVFIYCLAAGRSALAAFLGTAPLRVLGDASYAMYILQAPLWGLTRYVMAALHVGNADDKQSLPYFLVFLALLLSASVLGSIYAEPFIRVRIISLFAERNSARESRVPSAA